MRWAAVLLGVVGGIVGCVIALVTLSSGSGAFEREWLGIVGFVCALLAGLGGLVARRRPRLGAPLMMAPGIVGCAAMNLYYADTYYLAALPLWLLGGVLAHLAPRAPS